LEAGALRMSIVVNVSDARVSNDPGETIVTYSLGSCIGVALYDPIAKAGGMLHYQLPASTIDGGRAKQNPNMFADTGFANLMAMLEQLGAQKKRLKVGIAGAAQMLNDANVFDIGRRNHTAIRKILWQHGLFIGGEQVGGKTPRTMYLKIADGSMSVKAENQVIAL
jgi:chemotaxis protein CheD